MKEKRVRNNLLKMGAVLLLLIFCILPCQKTAVKAASVTKTLNIEENNICWTINVYDDGTVGIKPKSRSDFSGDIVIPAVVGDYTVNKIERGAFGQNNNITSVTVPEGITQMDAYSFYDCSNLESVNFPEGLINIGELAFQNCPKLKEVSLPSTLQSLGKQAFENCDSIEEIYIPAALTDISNGAPFGECDNLAAFSVDSDNPAFISKDGILMSKDMTKIINFPGKKTGSYTSRRALPPHQG